MDCTEDLNFNDDSGKSAVEKAKETILLMKKKMFRSHDLILQYNNKLKECDRLKEDLSVAQNDAATLKRENSLNLSKITELELHIVEYKNKHLQLERKIVDQDSKIAGDKCHIQQLMCKLEETEERHSVRMMEMDLTKSSLEVKVNEFEQELKKLKKVHQGDVQKLGMTIEPPKLKRRSRKGETNEKQMVDVGVNTTEELIPKIIKPVMADKLILTDDFYHIKDNPYPIHCDRCETLITPSMEKICKIMTAHPPLLDEMMSPPRPRFADVPSIPISNRLDDLPVTINKTVSQEYRQNASNTGPTPEIENLIQKVAALERKIKKRNKQNLREAAQTTSGNCCGHSLTSNCCPHPPSHAIPNVLSTVQTDFMSEFWNRIMKFTKKSSPEPETRRKRLKVKSRKLNKRRSMISLKNKRNCGSTSWNVESEDCSSELENSVVDSKTNKSHILRLQPEDNVEIEFNESSAEKVASGAENRRINSLDHLEEFSERFEQTEPESPIIKVPRKRGRPRLVPKIKPETLIPKETNIIEDTMNRRSSSRIQERSLRSRERSKEKNFIEPESMDSAPISINDSQGHIFNDSSQNSIEKSASILTEDDFSDGAINHHSDSEIKPTSFAEQKNMRKRKRSVSPKATKSTRSKLLEKIRSLKKNSIKASSKAFSNLPTVETQQKASNETESNVESKNLSEIPLKRQRIAHVPKIASKEFEMETNDITEEQRLQKIDECRISAGKSKAIIVSNEPVIPLLAIDKILKVTNDNDSSRKISSFDSKSNSKVTVPIKSPMQEKIHSVVNDPPKPESSKASTIEDSARCAKHVPNPSGIHDDEKSMDAEKISKDCAEETMENSLSIQTTTSPKNLKCSDSKNVESMELPIKIARGPLNSVIEANKRLIRAQPIETLSSSPAQIVSVEGPSITPSNIIKSSLSPKVNKTKDTARSPCENKGETSMSVLLEQVSIKLKSVVNPEVSNDLPNASSDLPESLLEAVLKSPGSSRSEKSISPPKISALESKSPVDRTSAILSGPSSPASFANDITTPPRSKKIDGAIAISDQNHSSEKIGLTSTPDNRFVNEPKKTAARSLVTYDEDLLETQEENEAKKLRTKQVLCNTLDLTMGQPYQEKPKDLGEEDTLASCSYNPHTFQRGIRCLGTLLVRHINDSKKKIGIKGWYLRRTVATKLKLEAEKTARTELLRLVETEEWTLELHNEVIAGLRRFCSLRTIAKSIVDFLIERADLDETLDRTHTPPAPVMTKTQQRITGLISGMEQDPTLSSVFELIYSGIYFHLFKTGYCLSYEVVEQFVRMLTVMARMKKDREKVRILCCDLVYYLGRKCSNSINTILSIWPEVFPMYGSQQNEVPNSIVHLIRTDPHCKATNLKKMLKDYYHYPEFQVNSKSLMEIVMNALSKNYTSELEAVILLIAKREGPEWTYKNIINGGLMKIIDDNDHPASFNALRLLGFLMRVFSLDDPDKSVASMVEKLCNMIHSAEASPDRQEGIISALLSISRHKLQFSKIADTILSWKPSRPMRITTIEQLNAFFKFRPVDWWEHRKKQKMKAKTEVENKTNECQ